MVSFIEGDATENSTTESNTALLTKSEHLPKVLDVLIDSLKEIEGDVRVRLILASDGSVRNIFPIKSLPNGLTESAMAAANQIKFHPAVRNGQTVSQFATFVYEFKKKDAKPYIPRTVF